MKGKLKMKTFLLENQFQLILFPVEIVPEVTRY